MGRLRVSTAEERDLVLDQARNCDSMEHLAQVLGVSGRTLRRARSRYPSWGLALEVAMGAPLSVLDDAPPEPTEARIEAVELEAKRMIDAQRDLVQAKPAPITNRHRLSALRDLFEIWSPEDQLRKLVEFQEGGAGVDPGVQRIAVRELNKIMFSAAAKREALRIDREFDQDYIQQTSGSPVESTTDVIDVEVSEVEPRKPVVWLELPRNGTEGPVPSESEVIEIAPGAGEEAG